MNEQMMVIRFEAMTTERDCYRDALEAISAAEPGATPEATALVLSQVVRIALVALRDKQ